MTIDELIAMAQEYLGYINSRLDPERSMHYASVAQAAAITAQAMMQRDEAAEARERAAPRWMFDDLDIAKSQEAQA
jgi:hypothetical protein